MNYPLASSTWDEAESQAINRVVQSGLLTMGKEVEGFEEQFAHAVGSRYAVMVNSGSSANLLATAALFYRQDNPLQAGDEVIVPAISWGTTYFPLTQYGLRLKFVDIDRNTLNLDLEAVAQAVSDRTRLVVAVNLLGNPNPFDALQKLLPPQVDLLEDSCEALGAVYQGRQAGTWGVMGTFSTFYSHHLSTIEGGMIVTDDEALYHILLSLRSHGWTRHLPEFNRVSGHKDLDPFIESYKFVLPGYNLRPTEIQGAIGLAQLEKWPNYLQVRRDNAQAFLERFAQHPFLSVQAEVGQSSWFGFSLALHPDCGIARQTIIQALNQAGIECRPIVAGNFVRQPVIDKLPHTVHGSLDNADWIHTHGLFVGNHHYPLTEQLAHLEQTLNRLKP